MVEQISFFLFLSFSFSLSALFAQKASKVEIVNADELGFDKALRGNITVFKGNCVFKQDNVIISCDSAYFDQPNNSFDAFGNVHITQDNVNIYGDLLNYDGNVKYAQLFNNVKVTDGAMELTTNNLDYDLKSRLSTYHDGGQVVDKSKNVLTSKLGYYYSTTHDAFFRKNVVLTNPDYLLNADTLRYNTQSEIAYLLGPSRIDGKDECLYAKFGIYNTKTDEAFFSHDARYENATQQLTSDSLYFNRELGKGRATRHVVFNDTVQKMLILGNFGDYDKKTETTFVTDSAVLVVVSEKDSLGNADSLFFAGDTLKTTLDSSKLHRVLYAYHDVRLYKKDLQARCDSMFYSNADSLVRCFKKPIAWAEKSQMTADYITIQLKNQQLHRLNLYNAAFIISPEDTVNYNQVKGKNMFGYFVNNQLRSMVVEGNGQSLYFAREDNGDYIGMNQSECSNMLIKFKSNKVQDITFITKPDATFFPIDQLPEQQKLKGFKWLGALQPQSKADLFKDRAALAVAKPLVVKPSIVKKPIGKRPSRKK